MTDALTRPVATLTILLLLFGLGCATAPARVAPAAIPTTDYDGLECSNLRERLLEAEADVERYWNSQRRRRNAQIFGWLVAFGPLIAIIANSRTKELAHAKGRVQTLNTVIAANCGTQESTEETP